MALDTSIPNLEYHRAEKILNLPGYSNNQLLSPIGLHIWTCRKSTDHPSC